MNLYEILEVSEKASKEIIDKAYRVLAKKYHPDLQNESEKQDAEKKMKQINDAYDTLGNDEKRKEYDEQLKEQREYEERKRYIEQQEKIRNESIIEQRKEIENELKTNIDIQQNRNVQSNINQNTNKNMNQNQQVDNIRAIQEEMNKAYRQAYNDYFRSRGYKIKEPWTWKKFLNLLKVIGILIIIILVIWFFPPTNKLLVDFYESNSIIKAVVNILGNILLGIWDGIKTFFIRIFN